MMGIADEDQAWARRWDLDQIGFGAGGGEPVPDGDVPERARQTFAERLAASFLTSEEMDCLRPPEALVDGVLFMDSLSWLIGEPANGKSFVALDWAGHVSEGLPWCGYPVRQGTVIYVCPEGTSGLVVRKQAWESAAQRMSRVHFVTMAVPAVVPGYWQSFIAEAVKREPALIIFDTQARMTVGMEENSAKDMGEWVNALEELREATHACVLVVHHKARNQKNMRGSTATEGAANTVISATRADRVIELSANADDGGKTKDVEPFPKIALRMVPTAGSVVLVPLSPGEVPRDAVAPDHLRRWWDLYRGEAVSMKVLTEGDGPNGVIIYSSRTVGRRAINPLCEGDDPIVERVGMGNAARYRLRRLP